MRQQIVPADERVRFIRFDVYDPAVAGAARADDVYPVVDSFFQTVQLCRRNEAGARPGDLLVLTNIWTGWNEPNASDEHLSQEANQAVAGNFCLTQRYEDNLVLLFERCQGGGGVSPADITGTYPRPAED